MIEELQRLWKAAPFVPFQLVLKDGRVMSIVQPAQFHHFPGTTEIVVRAPGQLSEHLGVSEVARIKAVATSANV
jgi:hypothetical protein